MIRMTDRFQTIHILLFAMRVRFVGAIFLIGCSLAAWPAAAQDPAPLAEDLSVYRDTLDMLQRQPYALRPFLMPGSEAIYLDGTHLDTTAYRIDYRFGKLWIDGLVPDPRRTLVAVYRTWGFTFEDYYRRRVLARPAEQELDSTGVLAVVEVKRREEAGPAGPASVQR